jgi:hypothetical protein
MKNHLIFLTLAVLIASCSKSSEDSSVPADLPVNKSNLLATGASANDLLSNASFDRIVIEVAHVQNFRPTQEAMDNFITFLRDRTFKQDITLIYRVLPSPGEETLTLQEIADLEKENRTEYNNGSTLAIYIYFADAPSDSDDEESNSVTLGAVYRNTSMVIHEATVRRLAARSALVSVADAETATINHEFGHLFGLVDLGSSEINPHEDPESENHCDQAGCLMRAELEFGSGLMSMLESRVGKGAIVPDLDPECLLDLSNNGGR